MNRLQQLKKNLKPGQVYRRESLEKWTNSVDRHLQELVNDGVVEKLSQGIYYVPEFTAFGKTPAKDTTFVAAFLKDNRFLLTSPNAYNSLGVGTSQLYNERIVYNHKRHEILHLGNRTFNFKKRYAFPLTVSEEFLLVDLVNNLASLAEDQELVLANVKNKVLQANKLKMKRCVAKFGDVKTKKLLMPLLD